MNFDTLIEDALCEPESNYEGLNIGISPLPVSRVVYHLHGEFREGKAIAPVVSFRDYAELIADENPWQREFLSTALKRGPLLLAGTSYRDPEIRHWLHLIMRDENPQHPAIVTIIREGLDLSQDEFATVKDALVSEWDTIGLTALCMHDLADVALVVRELQFLG